MRPDPSNPPALCSTCNGSGFVSFYQRPCHKCRPDKYGSAIPLNPPAFKAAVNEALQPMSPQLHGRFTRLRAENERLQRENTELQRANARLRAENEALHALFTTEET